MREGEGGRVTHEISESRAAIESLMSNPRQARAIRVTHEPSESITIRVAGP